MGLQRRNQVIVLSEGVAGVHSCCGSSCRACTLLMQAQCCSLIRSVQLGAAGVLVVGFGVKGGWLAGYLQD
jgi:hypothetical protein